MRTEKLGGEDREDIYELFHEEIAAKVFSDRGDERTRLNQGIKVRGMMRHVWTELERGCSPAEIVDGAELEAVRIMAGRTQSAMETSVSLHRRLCRLAITAVMPFAVLPGSRQAASR